MTRTLALGVEQRQQQGLSPRLQHAVHLLQLSSFDFAQEVYDALGRNAFLEPDESGSESPDGEAARAKDGGPPVLTEPMAEAQEMPDVPSAVLSESGAAVSEANNDFDDERESWQADALPGKQRNEAGTANPLDMRAVEESLRDYLLGQLHVLPLSQRDLTLTETIVGSLDDDGYLHFLLSELLDITGLDPPPGEEELHIALSQVQALDPPGIAARSVAE